VTGFIKWFSQAKGYGFIKGDDGKDVFVHYSAFPTGHTRDLGDIDGRLVAFDLEEQEDGRFQAKNVELL